MPLSKLPSNAIRAFATVLERRDFRTNKSKLTESASELGGVMSTAAPITITVGDENKKVQQMLKKYQMEMDRDNIRSMKSAVERSKRYDLKSSITMKDAEFAVTKIGGRQPRVELSDALIANQVVSSEQITDLIQRVAAKSR